MVGKRGFHKTQGAHGYQGKRAGRGSRLLSKILKGVDGDGIKKAFEKLEKEKDLTNKDDGGIF